MTVKGLAECYEEGRTHYCDWVKVVTASTPAGYWYDLATAGGNPTAQYYFSTPLESAALARSTHGGLDHGGDIPNRVKYLHTAKINSTLAFAFPSTFELLDYCLYYPGIPMSEGLTELTQVDTLTRHTDGNGLQIMVVAQNPYGGGSTFRVNYINQQGQSKTTPTHTVNNATILGSLATSRTTAAGATGRFMALASGDTGVRRVESVEFLTGDTGLICLVLVKPITSLFMMTAQSDNQFDFWHHYSILPRVEPDAYLNWIGLPNTAFTNGTIRGSLTFVWE